MIMNKKMTVASWAANPSRSCLCALLVFAVLPTTALAAALESETLEQRVVRLEQ